MTKQSESKVRYEELIYRKTYQDGRVEAVNTWATGFQFLVFDNQEHFERSKKAYEKRPWPDYNQPHATLNPESK